MKKPTIKKEWIQPLFTNRFLNVYDLNADNSHHYFNASRRKLEDLVAIKTDEEFKAMLPDAVSCVVILDVQGEKKLLLSKEYRYPCGQMLLSVPAGLIDEVDKQKENPLFSCAIRELYEETGITFQEKDSISVINPCLFSTPGMSDESNAIVKMIIHLEDLSSLTQDNAQGGEVFDGFILCDENQAKEFIQNGKDEQGCFYSVYTWIGLTSFLFHL